MLQSIYIALTPTTCNLQEGPNLTQTGSIICSTSPPIPKILPLGIDCTLYHSIFFPYCFFHLRVANYALQHSFSLYESI